MDDSATIRVPDETEGVSAKILVVDDQPIVRSLQTKLLEQMGLQADSAENGVDALQKLAAGGFDLLITDCEMPRMDGYELAQAIRTGSQDYRDMPIIACTAHAIPEVTGKCLDAGMNSVLSKPMRFEELAGELRQALPGLQVLKQTTTECLLFDEQQFRRLSGGNTELRETLAESFLEDYRRSCSELAVTIEALDCEGCCEIAHRNKGACAVFGALELGAAFADMENLTQRKQASIGQLRSALECIERAGSQLTAEFATLNC